MANKSLTDLTARTATADSDLLHINSGGTDYKETKANFLKGDFLHSFNNTSTLTSQVDALSTGTYFGGISGYGKQTKTGLPVNANCYVKAQKYTSSTYSVIEIWSINNAQEQHWIIFKNNGTWGSWEHVPARSEITSLNNSLTNIVTYTSLAPILKNGWSLNGASYYGKIGDLGFVQVGIRNGTMNTVGFTLPNGYKPNEAMIVPIFTASGVANGYAYFETSGDVTFYSQTYNSGAYFNAIYRRA